MGGHSNYSPACELMMIPMANTSAMDVLAADDHEVAGLVSVIIPTYNAAEFIESCLLSVLHQTYPDMEVIVVDDGSEDSTRQVLAPYIAQGKIKYLYQQNGGPAAARNLALRHARGEFIAFQDADDLWVPEKLEMQVATLRQNPDIGMVYSDTEWFGEEWERQRKHSRKLRDFERRNPKRFRRGRIFNGLLGYNFIPTIAVLVRRSVLRQTGVFLEEINGQRFSFGEDFELWLRISKICNVEFSPQKLAMRRVHRNQITANKRDGYRQACALYGYLWSRSGWPEKGVLARKYLEISLKRMIAGILKM
jgi:glycosyltransferase involved in cell wall biosynthesis